MSRIQVTATVNANVLRLVREDGKVALEATPNEVVTIGNSIGGYVVAPMPRKPHVWGFWRVTGGDRERLAAASVELPEGVRLNGRATAGDPAGLLRQLTSGDPERVAVNGRQYLLATSSGSARNGVLHAYRPVTDPVEIALRFVGCDKITGKVVPLQQAIGWERGDRRTTQWSAFWTVASDGNVQFRPSWEGQRGTVGRLEELTDVANATYVVRHYHGYDGVSGRREVMVAMSDRADHRKVADAIVRLVRGKDADFDLVEAMKNLDKAREWVATRYQVEDGADAFSVRVNGERFLIHHSDRWSEREPKVSRVLRSLREQWGPELFRPWFTESNLRWAAAYRDPAAMIAFLREEATIASPEPCGWDGGKIFRRLQVGDHVLHGFVQYVSGVAAGEWFPDGQVEDMFKSMSYDQQREVVKAVLAE